MIPYLTPNQYEEELMRDNDCWALVLAAGEERRLSSLTTDSSGITVPKQFCSLNGVSSSLGDAVGRAQRLVTRDHVCCLVASDHRKWWKHDLADLPA